MPEPSRKVAQVIPAIETLEGAGFVVRRPFPRPGLDQIDPFLLIDHMGPVDHAPGAAKGAPDHPHRGFETVSYILEGELEHKDSVGNHGVLGPGDVQWMTAGAGVVHSEMPSLRMQREGGRLHGFQIWVNLPRADKMVPPRYQEIAAQRIPRVEREGVVVRVIAGQALDTVGAVETHTPILYLHVTLDPGARVELDAAAELNAVVYVISGEGRFGPDRVEAEESDLVVFHHDGARAALAADDTASGPLDVLVLAGRPLGEPLARYGPFVMNTRSELVEAVEDFQAGRMGRIGVA